MEMIDEFLLQEGYIEDQLQQQLELIGNRDKNPKQRSNN